MKTMKKLLAVILAMTLTMAMGICASASSQGGGDGDGTNAAPKGSITVTNAIVGETYTLYKVFNATVANGRADEGTGISYTSTWFTKEIAATCEYFDVDDSGNITIKPEGKKDSGELSDDAITWLKSQKVSNFTKIGQPVKATSTTVKWEDLDPGYYYIDTTTGSFVTVDSITPNVNVEDKNSLPSHDKKQATAADGTFGDDLLELNIGDTVYYQTEIKIGKGSDKPITLTDTMTSGLDLNQSAITVKKGSETVPASNYDLTPSEHGFTLVLKADYVQKLSNTDVITVAYSAVINEKAAIDSATGNSNKAKLEYSKQTATDTVYVATYDFQLFKTDGSAEHTYLPGATFKLYDALTGGNLITVGKDDSDDPRYYLDSTKDVEIEVTSADGVNVRGLKPGTYYLEEIHAPSGYNKLTERKPVTITSKQDKPHEVSVENHAGAELPNTGGRGTTLLYAIGAALVIGAAVLLIARRRTEQ